MLHPRDGGPKKTAREIQGLRGPVRSVFIATATPIDRGRGWEPGDQKPASLETYDKQGNHLEYVAYTPDGAVRERTAFSYDTQGNEIEMIRYTGGDAPASRAVSLYSTEGYRTESRLYAADGTLTHRTVITTDAHGNAWVMQSYDSQGRLESRTTSTYDASGNLEETSWYYADGQQGGQTVYRRDAKGVLLSSTSFAYAPDGTLQGRTDAAYDIRGNPTEVIWYGESGRSKKTERSTYRYDVFGNWTQRTTTTSVVQGNVSSFAPPVVAYRTITYYGKGTE
jgi:antitoxin component YwqK of YwqJK toxin-antitoxin module